MTDEDLNKPRRTCSISLNVQSSHEGCSSDGVDEIFISKRVKLLTIVYMCCKYLDPIFLVLRLLRLIWQQSITLIDSVLRLLKKFISHCQGNIKWFVENHPPLVLFTLAIALFAILLTTLAFYVSNTSTLINEPNVSQDWNMFLQSFSNVEFCVIQDNSSMPVQRKKTKKTRPAGKNIRSFSVKMSLTVYPTKEFVSVPHSFMHLSTSMIGKYIGLKGDEGRQKLNITVVVPYHWNISSCSSIPLHGCQTVQLDVCMELTGPTALFPATNLKPKTCPMPSLSGVDYWARMNWQLLDMDSLYYCRSRTMIGLQHEHDQSLFQPLRKPHVSVIQLHLLHTSFFLYVFVAIMLIYALIFNHAKQAIMSQPESI